jgi:hypothetical protein
VRVVHPTSPIPDARAVEPELEDAFIYTLNFGAAQ